MGFDGSAELAKDLRLRLELSRTLKPKGSAEGGGVYAVNANENLICPLLYSNSYLDEYTLIPSP